MLHEHATVVFLGPSLPVAEARAILPARYEPPARLGSIYEIIGSEVAAIVLLDGVFHNQPSVWQREIDAAIQAGILVFGASSMGALRAAELHRFGMVGHGVVFDWYHRGVIDGDDEVALLHGDAETEFRPLSEPMVNIRYTLERAVEAGVVPAARLAPILAMAKRTYFPHRSFARLVEDLRGDPALAGFADPLAQYVSAHRVDIKRTDAISLLELVADLRGRGDALATTLAALTARDPFVVRARHGRAVLKDHWQRHGQLYRRLEHEGHAWTLEEIWKLVDADEGTVEVPNLGGTGSIALSVAMRRQLADDRVLRDLALAYARSHDLVTPPRFAAHVAARLQAAVSSESWRQACRMTAPELDDRLAAEAVVAWFADTLPTAVARTTASWIDPMDGRDPCVDVGLYLRVFATHAERLACRRVALAELLERVDHEITSVPTSDWSGLLERVGGARVP